VRKAEIQMFLYKIQEAWINQPLQHEKIYINHKFNRFRYKVQKKSSRFSKISNKNNIKKFNNFWYSYVKGLPTNATPQIISEISCRIYVYRLIARLKSDVHIAFW